MNQQIIVNVNGAALPAIGFGTLFIKDEACTALVGEALKSGYRHIDTAANYGNETEVGRGLKAGGVPRDKFFLTTKVWHTELANGKLQASAETSLGKLGVDYVDLLLIHWPNPAIPLEDSIPALCEVKKRGLARHIGVSNFTVAMLDKAVSLASEPIVCNQVEYHPYLAQTKLMAACRRHGMALTAYCPLGRGGIIKDPVIGEIAAAHNRTPAQVLLRWSVQQPNVVAIPRSTNAGRIRENLDIFGFELTAAEMSRIAALARPDGRVVKPPFAPHWDV